MNIVAQNMKRARAATGMSQHAVAYALAVPDRTYARWESGDRAPDVATLRRIATALGVTLSSLVEEDE